MLNYIRCQIDSLFQPQPINTNVRKTYKISLDIKHLVDFIVPGHKKNEKHRRPSTLFSQSRTDRALNKAAGQAAIKVIKFNMLIQLNVY
jgi:hypothetical protein